MFLTYKKVEFLADMLYIGYICMKEIFIIAKKSIFVQGRTGVGRA